MMKLKLKLITAIFFTVFVNIVFCSSQNYQEILTNTDVNAVPKQRNIVWNDESKFYDSIVEFWAQKDVVHGKKNGKVKNPRIILARLHSKLYIEETNQIP